MKKILTILLMLLIPLATTSIVREDEKVFVDTVIEEPLSEWEVLYLAIVDVESGGDPNAVGAIGDGGVIQILPEGKRGYLDEANRLVGYRKYTNEDRFCPDKSREIFDVVQSHHNPNKDIDRAIKLHNSGGGVSYRNKILLAMKNIQE